MTASGSLFVAEKRAAIDAVVGRLDRLGLGDLVLDAAQRRHQPPPPRPGARRGPRAGQRRRRPRHQRGRADAAGAPYPPHRPRHGAARAPRAVGCQRLRRAGRADPLTHRRNAPTSRVRIHGEALRAVSRGRVRELARELTDAASLGAWTTDRADDPWYAARVATADEAAQALEIASRLSTGGLDAAQERLGAALQEAGLPPATRPADWGTRSTWPSRPGRRSRRSAPRCSTCRWPTSSAPPRAGTTAPRTASSSAGSPGCGCAARPAPCCGRARRRPTCTPGSCGPRSSGWPGGRSPAPAPARPSPPAWPRPSRPGRRCAPTWTGWAPAWHPRPPVAT